MSQNKQESCARCKAYLFSEDDVVYCPICGAPHHRECFSANDHCALEEFHGTDKEYKKDKAAITKQVEKSENQNSEQDFSRFQSFNNFDFLGGVPADYVIENDVTAEEAKKFVFSNTHRYIPKFVKLVTSSKISWNWAAFLFPCGWMLSRKMYSNGIIAGFFTIIASLLSIPLNISITNLGIADAANYQELLAKVYDSMPQMSSLILISAFLGMLIELVTRIVSGLFGDFFYKNHCIKKISEIKLKSDDINFDFQKQGGVNIFLFMIGFFAIEYIPSIIFSLL